MKPDFIGGGIGRMMWQHACNTGQNKYHVDTFILWEDPGAQGFYALMGCEVVGYRKSAMINDRYPPIMQYNFNQIKER